MYDNITLKLDTRSKRKIREIRELKSIGITQNSANYHRITHHIRFVKVPANQAISFLCHELMHEILSRRVGARICIDFGINLCSGQIKRRKNGANSLCYIIYKH